MTDVMVQTPPLLQGPSEKEQKYDRQLRLWAASGQAALESANILLANSGPATVGVETLKNLVLPGIGRFVIADEAVVTDADLGVNFFLDESHLGKSRAQSCTELLTELNPDVEGGWYPKTKVPLNLTELLATSLPFTMIIYTLPMASEQIEILNNYAQTNNTPLVAIHSVGFYSYFHIRLPGTFPIVDTHPEENATTDLRLLAPWPELYEFARDMTKNIESLDDHDHGHLPLVVILLHFLDQWKQNHADAYPTSYADKTKFRTMVSDAMRRGNPEGGEENFEEAVASVMKQVTAPFIPSSLKEVFDYEHANKDKLQSSFWVIAEAVKAFYEMYGCLPVPGGLPDMKAESSIYIKLQNIYKDKARKDANEVLTAVRSIAGGNDVDLAEVEMFCTNARFIKLINSTPDDAVDLNKVVERELSNDEIAAVAGPEMPLSLVPVYMALTATSHVATASSNDIMASICQKSPAAASNPRMAEAAKEVSRAAGAELHNISAATGGMVAQEVIKVITKQYIPIDNTCIFDGIESRCQVLCL